MSKPADQSLSVTARSPFRLYYEGPAISVSGKNRVGVFDVLPGHADFFSMLLPEPITITTDTEEIAFEITSGIVTVRNNNVMLFVNM